MVKMQIVLSLFMVNISVVKETILMQQKLTVQHCLHQQVRTKVRLFSYNGVQKWQQYSKTMSSMLAQIKGLSAIT